MKFVEIIFSGRKKFLKSEARALRGYLGNIFKDVVEFHNHLDQITFNYRSPEIQYRVIDGKISVLGINNGGDILLKNMEKIDIKNIVLKGIDNEIISKEIKITFPELKVIDELKSYMFESFWIALGEENYLNYKRGEVSLNKILRNNIIEFFKLCKVQATEKIFVDGEFKEELIMEKNAKLVVFTGSFKTNVILPEYIALGKRKSVGYGLIKKGK